MTNFLLILMMIFSGSPNEKLHTSCIYPTVKVEGENGRGSGFIVRSSLSSNKAYSNVVITSDHFLNKEIEKISVFTPQFENWSKFKEFKEYNAIKFKSSAKYDFSILIFESENQLPVVEVDYEPKIFISDKIFKIGYGLGDDSRLDKGEITSINIVAPQHYVKHIRINAHTIFGDSGGPCFLEENYKAIGITRAIRATNDRTQFLTSQAYLCPLSWIKDWNKELNNELSFVFDSNIPVPLSADINKKNVLEHLKAKFKEIHKDIEEKTEIEKQLDIAIKTLEM